jgi:hypothetical protein
MHTAHPITLQKYVTIPVPLGLLVSASISTIFSPQASTHCEQYKPNLFLKVPCPPSWCRNSGEQGLHLMQPLYFTLIYILEK